VTTRRRCTSACQETVCARAIGKRFPIAPVEELEVFDRPTRVIRLNCQDVDKA
jgi:hypothetical protein